MINYLIDNKEWLAGVFAGVVGFFSGRKIKRQNIFTVELQNLKAVREEEKQLIADLIDINNRNRKIIIDYEDTINALSERLKTLNEKLQTQATKIKELQKLIKTIKNEK